MTLQQIYELAIDMGKKADPRGEKEVNNYLARNKKQVLGIPEKKKKYIDKETLINPYSDSRILYGDIKIDVKKILVGIDADASEILLADRLNQKGEKINLVVSHHPSSHALASLHEVMDLQVDVFESYGIPSNVAHALLETRKGEVQRKISPLNHNQAVDTARLLDIPLLVLHTIWDNLGDNYMKNYLAKKEFRTAGEVLDYVNEIPEFQEAAKGKAAPTLTSGSESSRAGKVVVSFTGGTNPSKELYQEMGKAGVGTIVEMHVAEEALKELQKLHINVIDTGHMAADSIGANLFLDALEKQGIEVIPCSGLIRIKRK